jgi:ADP-heptose:LPS heptosyltransferase
MGTTVIRAVKAKFPDAEVDFMTEAPNVNTLEGNPDLNKIIVGGSYFEALDVFVTGKYDKIYKLNMINHIESSWHHIPEMQNQHLVEWYGKKAEVDVSQDKNIYVYPSEQDKSVSDSLFASLNIDGKKSIIFHTSSGQHAYGNSGEIRVESKDWPIDCFEALAERLINKGYNVVQIGLAKDKKLKHAKVIDVTGKLTFKQTMSFASNFSGYIGVDSGPAYLAGQAGIPVLLLMGATQNQTKDNKGPSVGPRNDNVEYINPQRPDHPMCKPVPCYIHCQVPHDVLGLGMRMSCIAHITVDEVYKKLTEKVVQ